MYCRIQRPLDTSKATTHELFGRLFTGEINDRELMMLEEHFILIAGLEDSDNKENKEVQVVEQTMLLIFKYCFNVSGSSETFTRARWTLLQVCPHVLFKGKFNILFLHVLKLRRHPVGDLLDLVRDVHEDTKGLIIKHGCLLKIRDDTKLLVIHDEAQFLGDEFNGFFQSMSSLDESPRPCPQSCMRFETSASISLRWLPVALAWHQYPLLGSELRFWFER
ncbi:hypothetical protein BGZ58_002827 [Dissophora ornata]|nr:hypothetical protein BGZ58_002827 [Dissophora ornata]